MGNEFMPIVLIALTAITSIMAFSNYDLRNKLIFNVSAILKAKEWYRLIASAFLHGDYMHLIFNMMTLYFFSDVVVAFFGSGLFLVMYFAAVLGGGLLSLLVHRREYYYTALGASGGVVGVLFGAIALYPNIGIGFFFIPGIRIPGWIFGIAYLAYSIYAMRNSSDNIGHEAHLGGAVVGLFLTILMAPQVIHINGMYIGIMLIPLIYLAFLVWKDVRK